MNHPNGNFLGHLCLNMVVLGHTIDPLNLILCWSLKGHQHLHIILLGLCGHHLRHWCLLHMVSSILGHHQRLTQWSTIPVMQAIIVNGELFSFWTCLAFWIKEHVYLQRTCYLFVLCFRDIVVCSSTVDNYFRSSFEICLNYYLILTFFGLHG